MYNKNIKEALENKGLGFLQVPGAYVLVDGQYGSTGKGLAAALLAEMFHDKVDLVTTNAGPNSGHTSYHNGEKIVLKQLPTFGVVASRIGGAIDIQMNAGAIVDIDILVGETKYYSNSHTHVYVHPNAALVDKAAKDVDEQLVSRIGSTGKGTGAALARKVMREEGATVGTERNLSGLCENMHVGTARSSHRFGTTFVEVSQGFSLGINQGFYPYCTSRDCTVAQALSDANIHPDHYRGSIMVVRTFPIRVAGNSGPCYSDQVELTWEQLGQKPELTTVTNKVRRVFTFSKKQFKDAVHVNRPQHIFVNFLNYLSGDMREFVYDNIVRPYREVMGRNPRTIIGGFGPKPEQCYLIFDSDGWVK